MHFLGNIFPQATRNIPRSRHIRATIACAVLGSQPRTNVVYCRSTDAFVIRDTHKLIAKLQQRGFSAQQAEGITEALREVDSTGLATKADLQDLKVFLIQWMTSIQLGYGAIIIAVVALL